MHKKIQEIGSALQKKGYDVHEIVELLPPLPEGMSITCEPADGNINITYNSWKSGNEPAEMACDVVKHIVNVACVALPVFRTEVREESDIW